ncbi:MAG: DUF4365 domain-containing protein [Nannocystis sp.]|nr:DUF4365 domain-containing protein [Nannocystis sp.]
MTPNQRREELSRAYVAAVAARCGFKLGMWTQDDDGLDVTIGAAGVLGGGTLAGPKLDVQLKCTSNARHDRGEVVVWQLRRVDYENLRASACTPRVLVVLMLPEDEERWIEHSPDSLILRRCAYWRALRGAPAIESEAESARVEIPKSSVFSPMALEQIMKQISRGEAL